MKKRSTVGKDVNSGSWKRAETTFFVDPEEKVPVKGFPQQTLRTLKGTDMAAAALSSLEEADTCLMTSHFEAAWTQPCRQSRPDHT